MAKENGDSEVAITITRSEPVMVHPVEEIGDEYYFLSNIDQNFVRIIKTVYLFKVNEGRSSEDVGQVIKEALAKVLVHFYPFAGRLTISPEGKLIVKCDGHGVPFVEAVAECAMEVLGDISAPDPEKLGKLVYTDPGATNILAAPLLTVQVTRFKCGGFVLGQAINHCMVDGRGIAEFNNSWAEIARGLPLSTPPYLDRTILRARQPPKIEFPYNNVLEDVEDISNLIELYNSEPFQIRSFTFDADKLGRLKQMAMEDGSLENCTSFAALTSLIWQARTRALKMGPYQKTKLLFAVDCRTRFEPPLPAGYFGNCVFLACCLCEARDLLDQPLSFAVRQVQTAIRGMTNEFIQSMIESYRPIQAMPLFTATLFLSTWAQLDFNSLDFGWGETVQFGPADLPPRDVALLLQSKERKCTTVILGLPARNMETFQELVDF